MTNTDPKSDTDRIQRLEESIAFSDHTTTELNSEIQQLNKTVLDLLQRLNRLESRLVDLNSRISEDAGNVPPPHSAGPDIPRDPL
jgi:uncharacterized coiled-coil protein SlyX